MLNCVMAKKCVSRKNRLIDNLIEKNSYYFGNAMRENRHTLDHMMKAYLEYLSKLSTDENLVCNFYTV